ncbi:MAG: prepilin-type N-terminal cleavage/methylation domain-containing protein [Candidatus Schekmanbacteria bacterium]|nr:prepilin-type N-terminal cleavage/methylation domain-containing protein [Candidatus Schekmanbacteria bacterium]
MTGPNKNRTGFTFLEIMVAVAILSISLIAALRAQSQSIRTAAECVEKIKLVNMAKEKIGEIEAQGFPNTGESEGEFEDYPGYYWKVTVKPVSSDILGLDKSTASVSLGDYLRDVKVTIYNERKDRELFSIETFVAAQE